MVSRRRNERRHAAELDDMLARQQRDVAATFERFIKSDMRAEETLRDLFAETKLEPARHSAIQKVLRELQRPTGTS